MYISHTHTRARARAHTHAHNGYRFVAKNSVALCVNFISMFLVVLHIFTSSSLFEIFLCNISSVRSEVLKQLKEILLFLKIWVGTTRYLTRELYLPPEIVLCKDVCFLEHLKAGIVGCWRHWSCGSHLVEKRVLWHYLWLYFVWSNWISMLFVYMVDSLVV